MDINEIKSYATKILENKKKLIQPDHFEPKLRLSILSEEEKVERHWMHIRKSYSHEYFVCERNSNKIIKISYDGKKTEESIFFEGIPSPASVFYDHDNQKLWVISLNGTAYIIKPDGRLEEKFDLCKNMEINAKLFRVCKYKGSFFALLRTFIDEKPTASILCTFDNPKKPKGIKILNDKLNCYDLFPFQTKDLILIFNKDSQHVTLYSPDKNEIRKKAISSFFGKIFRNEIRFVNIATLNEKEVLFLATPNNSSIAKHFLFHCDWNSFLSSSKYFKASAVYSFNDHALGIVEGIKNDVVMMIDAHGSRNLWEIELNKCSS